MKKVLNLLFLLCAIFIAANTSAMKRKRKEDSKNTDSAELIIKKSKVKPEKLEPKQESNSDEVNKHQIIGKVNEQTNLDLLPPEIKQHIAIFYILAHDKDTLKRFSNILTFALFRANRNFREIFQDLFNSGMVSKIYAKLFPEDAIDALWSAHNSLMRLKRTVELTKCYKTNCLLNKEQLAFLKNTNKKILNNMLQEPLPDSKRKDFNQCIFNLLFLGIKYSNLKAVKTMLNNPAVDTHSSLAIYNYGLDLTSSLMFAIKVSNANLQNEEIIKIIKLLLTKETLNFKDSKSNINKCLKIAILNGNLAATQAIISYSTESKVESAIVTHNLNQEKTLLDIALSSIIKYGNSDPIRHQRLEIVKILLQNADKHCYFNLSNPDIAKVTQDKELCDILREFRINL